MKINARLGFGLIMLLASACSPSGTKSPAIRLTVEEHALRGAPALEPLSFSPVESSMQAILALHADERAKVIPDESVLIDGNHAIRAALGQDVLTATDYYGGVGSASWVAVTRNDTEIYRIETGMPSPITGLHGFWTYGDHWALETVYIAPETIAGLLAIDGKQEIPGHGYDEAFDFQILAGEPFYFARQGDKIGYFFGGAFTDAGYSEIPHYQCCSASALNPIHSGNMIAFFARRADTWYYVEAGVFHE